MVSIVFAHYVKGSSIVLRKMLASLRENQRKPKERAFERASLLEPLI